MKGRGEDECIHVWRMVKSRYKGDLEWVQLWQCDECAKTVQTVDSPPVVEFEDMFEDYG
jgi:hypothetical protein